MSSRCSYCKAIGHDIRNCNHSSIQHNINLIRERYTLYNNNRRGSPISRALFVNYLRNSFNLLQIRSIVARLRIGNASVSKPIGIECIYNYLNQQDILANLSPEPEEDTLAWYIDRTPAIIPTPSYTLLTNPVQTRVSLHNQQLEPDEEDILHEAGLTLEDVQVFARAFVNRINNTTRVFVPSIRKMQMKLVLNYCDDNNKSFECPICFDCISPHLSIKLNCSHVFCSNCIEQTIKNCQDKMNCALCRQNVTTFQVQSIALYDSIKQHSRIECV